MKKNLFSLIELLTVIVTILVLMTLLAPMISKLRMKAHTAICANNLKQLGTLISVYALNNDGYLPRSSQNSYKDFKDYSKLYFNQKNVKLRYAYDNWAGHLLPYFSGLGLKDYSRGRGGEKVVYSMSRETMTMPTKSKINPNYGNYMMFEDMANNGGHGSLKTLLCPTSISTSDAHALPKGYYIPRIAGLTNRYGQGMVSSYIGNGELFGNRVGNSIRLEDAAGNNMLLGEGSDYGDVGKHYMPGLCFNAGSGGNAYSSAGTFSMHNAYVGSNNLRKNNVAFSFMHDDTEEIWVSYKSKGSRSFVARFNKAYAPNAAASYDYGAPEHLGFTLASNRYPGEEWENFNGLFKSFGVPKTLIGAFHQVDTKFGYGFGNTNILSADLSVSNRHIGWLYENGKEISYFTSK